MATTGSIPCGVFFLPDGSNVGSTETLCRHAIRNPSLADCVDALAACARTDHTTRARADKGWLKAYLAMLPDPTLRFDQAFAVTDGIDPQHACFDSLRTFLAAL